MSALSFESPEPQPLTPVSPLDSIEPVEVNVPRVLINAISNRSFAEYRTFDPSSKAAIHRRNRMAEAFAALDLLHPNIFRGIE